MKKTYTELIRLKTFQERYEYLRIAAKVASETFGYNRYLNQILYHSDAWKKFRRDIIIRDNGCDLAHPDYDNVAPITVHHINPITLEDVLDSAECIFDPDNVVCASDETHKAIHYGTFQAARQYTERRPGDTCPWR